MTDIDEKIEEIKEKIASIERNGTNEELSEEQIQVELLNTNMMLMMLTKGMNDLSDAVSDLLSLQEIMMENYMELADHVGLELVDVEPDLEIQLNIVKETE